MTSFWEPLAAREDPEYGRWTADGQHTVDSQPEMRAAMRAATAATLARKPKPAPDLSLPPNVLVCGQTGPLTEGDAAAVREFAATLSRRGPWENYPTEAEVQAPWVEEKPEKCDVCRAADLVASGVMPSSIDETELHGRCRAPGECPCGCDASQGGRCVNCSRNRPLLALDQTEAGYECIDTAECAAAMLEAGTAAPGPKSSAKSTSASPRASRPKSPRSPQSRTAGVTARPCLCGCGEVTGGGNYRSGHDSKHLKTLVAGVKARGITLEAAILQLPSPALEAKLRARLET